MTIPLEGVFALCVYFWTETKASGLPSDTFKMLSLGGLCCMRSLSQRILHCAIKFLRPSAVSLSVPPFPPFARPVRLHKLLVCNTHRPGMVIARWTAIAGGRAPCTDGGHGWVAVVDRGHRKLTSVVDGRF